MFFNDLDQLFSPEDKAGLGAAKHFVSASGDHIRTFGDRLLNGQLLLKSELSRVEKASIAEIVDERNSIFSGKFFESIRRRRFGKPHDAVVARMAAQDCGGAFGDRFGVIGK